MPEQTLAFAADHPAFAGHFPGAPIVPVVLLLDAALQALQVHCVAVREVASAKFLSPVGPDQPVRLVCEVTAAGRVRFDITGGQGQPVAAGQLQVEPGP